jgi:ABC-type polar amino acid transport system ATPase subunit
MPTFEDYGFFPRMSAGEDVLLPPNQRFLKQKKAALKKIAANMPQSVGLEQSVYRQLPNVIILKIKRIGEYNENWENYFV